MNRVRIALGIGALAVAGGAIGGYVAATRFAARSIVDEARKRGVDLYPGSVEIGFGRVTISRAAFSLVGVRGFSGIAESIGVDLEGLAPARVAAAGVKLSIVGSAADLAVELSEWSRLHADALAAPVAATRVSIDWRPELGSPPWLVVNDGSVERGTGGTTFTASSATVGGVPVGVVGASWTSARASVVMGFGKSDLALAPVRLEVHPTDTPPTADVTLAPTPAADLASPLGLRFPVERVVASGTAHLVLRGGLARGALDGAVSAVLEGYVPPHPRELDGFAFGQETRFSSKLAVSTDRALVALTDTEVQAGAFKLRGHGDVKRRADAALGPRDAKIHLDLRGAIPCAAVAESVAVAHLGSTLGRLFAGVAQPAIRGSIDVHVEIRADASDLGAARVEPAIGVGCGMKPLTELGLLPSAKDLAEMGRQIQRLPDAFPIPSGLPPIPEES